MQAGLPGLLHAHQRTVLPSPKLPPRPPNGLRRHFLLPYPLVTAPRPHPSAAEGWPLSQNITVKKNIPCGPTGVLPPLRSLGSRTQCTTSAAASLETSDCENKSSASSSWVPNTIAQLPLDHAFNIGSEPGVRFHTTSSGERSSCCALRKAASQSQKSRTGASGPGRKHKYGAVGRSERVALAGEARARAKAGRRWKVRRRGICLSISAMDGDLVLERMWHEKKRGETEESQDTSGGDILRDLR